MGIQERKNREKEERRSRILDEAKELILEHGIDALSMQEIADGAELSKATLYLYFQSKEAILKEILAESATAFVEYVESRISPGSTGIEALRTLWASYMSLYGDSHEVFVLTGISNFLEPGFLLDLGRTGADLETPPGRMLAMIASVLERGIADGTLKTDLKPLKLARTVILIATAIIDTVARLPRPARDSRIILAEMRGVFELLIRGLAAEGTDRSLLTLPDMEPGRSRNRRP
jgi:AcrR family transcriptional regulator